MAMDFTQDSVLHYLQSSGGSVKNSDLLLHFRGFLRDHKDQVRNRDLFKKFVNSVATVKQEDGVSHVVLRKKFRGFVPGSGGTGGPAAERATPAWSSDKPRGKAPKREVRETAPAAGDAILPAAGIVLDNNNSGDFNLSKSGSGSSPGPGPGPRQAPKPQQVIPGVAAAPAREQRAVKAARQTVGFAPPPELHPAAPAPSLQPGAARGEAGPPQGLGLTPGPQAGGGVPPPDDLQQQVRLVRHRKSYKTAVSYDDDEEEEEEGKVPMVVGSTAGARPPSEPLGRLDRAASTPCLLDQIAPPPVSSSSTGSPSSERKPPKIYIQDVEGQTPQPHARRWPPEQGAGLGGHWAGRVPAAEPAAERRSVPVQRYTPSPRRGEEEEEGAGLQAYEQDRRSSQAVAVQGKGWSQSERARLSSSHSSVFSPSSDAGFSSSEWPSSGSPRGSGWNSSYEDFQGGAAEVGRTKGQEVLQRAQESVLHRGVVKTSIPWHRSAEQLHVDQEFEARAQTLYRSTDRLNENQLPTPKVLPWHLSTGDLYDDVESSDGSTSSPPPLHPSVARCVSSRLRSRMCRSLGANLDQLLQEEEAAVAEGGAGAGGGAMGNEAARLNRLHMISSSLSLRHHLSSSSLSSCSTPPRCHSMADLTEDPEHKGRKRRSQPGSAPSAGPAPRQDTSSSQQSPVPLEPREHDWLVKGAAGAWPDIYSLFREDPSLLNRRDFISGFTVLHWIAKHGDHRVLNTLWYGVEKAGLTLDVDARSACGHTPLHLAAMHNNKNMIRLLVSKFNADVKQRDTAGKRPWHYLSKAMPPDVFQMLGAPPRAALEGGAARGEADAGEPAYEPRQHHHKQRQHRRRHHLSFASSGERPVTVGGKVKRSTSIAAFLKRKSLAQFQGLHSDSSV